MSKKASISTEETIQAKLVKAMTENKSLSKMEQLIKLFEQDLLKTQQQGQNALLFARAATQNQIPLVQVLSKYGVQYGEHWHELAVKNCRATK